jgi:uncharacterized protein (TIGR02757 family)
MGSMPAVDLKPESAWLERQRLRYHHRRYVDPDPLALLYPYEDPRDREIVGLIAASLAYGNVKAMLPAIRRVLDVLGPAPARTLPSLSRRRIAGRLRGFRYRFTSGEQIGGLLVAVARVVAERGSLEAAFAAHMPREADTVLPALEGFVREMSEAAPCALAHLLPCPSRGSACKRLNLFLRWMVRKDAIDLGVWSSVSPSRLVIPLDTHVIRVGRCLRLTRYASPGWKMAADITASLRAVDAADPVRYDFALCHVGMMGACGFEQEQGDRQCPLRGSCRPGG